MVLGRQFFRSSRQEPEPHDTVVPTRVLLMGDCGTGKSTLFEKLVGDGTCGHSSSAALSFTKDWVVKTSQDDKVAVIDTPGQNVLSHQLANNKKIASALGSGPLSLIIVTAKAEQRMESIRSQVAAYLEQLCDFDCVELLCVAVTHMDTPGLRWKEKHVKQMLSDSFGLETVVFSGHNTSRNRLLQQVLSQARKPPRMLVDATKHFEESYICNDDTTRAMKSINDSVARFSAQLSDFVAEVNHKQAPWFEHPALLGHVIFDFRKYVEEEYMMNAKKHLSKLNSWGSSCDVDLPVHKKKQQEGYLINFENHVLQKLDNALKGLDERYLGLQTAQPHLVRACQHCGFAQSSLSDSFKCGECSPTSEYPRRNYKPLAFNLVFAADKSALKLDSVMPAPQTLAFDAVFRENCRQSGGCGNRICWEDMKPAQLPIQEVRELEDKANAELERKRARESFQRPTTQSSRSGGSHGTGGASNLSAALQDPSPMPPGWMEVDGGGYYHAASDTFQMDLACLHCHEEALPLHQGPLVCKSGMEPHRLQMSTGDFGVHGWEEVNSVNGAALVDCETPLPSHGARNSEPPVCQSQPLLLPPPARSQTSHSTGVAGDHSKTVGVNGGLQSNDALALQHGDGDNVWFPTLRRWLHENLSCSG